MSEINSTGPETQAAPVTTLQDEVPAPATTESGPPASATCKDKTPEELKKEKLEHFKKLVTAEIDRKQDLQKR